MGIYQGLVGCGNTLFMDLFFSLAVKKQIGMSGCVAELEDMGSSLLSEQFRDTGCCELAWSVVVGGRLLTCIEQDMVAVGYGMFQEVGECFCPDRGGGIEGKGGQWPALEMVDASVQTRRGIE